MYPPSLAQAALGAQQKRGLFFTPTTSWAPNTHPLSQQEALGSGTCHVDFLPTAETRQPLAVGVAWVEAQGELALGVLCPPGGAHGPW